MNDVMIDASPSTTLTDSTSGEHTQAQARLDHLDGQARLTLMALPYARATRARPLLASTPPDPLTLGGHTNALRTAEGIGQRALKSQLLNS